MNGLRRLRLFIDERFPLVPSIAAAALMAVSADVLGSTALQRPAHIDRGGGVLTLVVLALLFVVRVVDDLRDLAHDARHHPDRPLPRGAVRSGDLVGAAVVVATSAVLLVSAVFGAFAAVAVAVVVAVTVVLQLDGGTRVLADRPVLTLLVHQPMVALWAALVACVSTSTMPTWSTAFALTPVCALAVSLSLVFELGRDVRPVDERTTDGSYVALWGPSGAAAALVASALLAGGIVAWLAVLLRLAWWSVAVPAVSLLVVVGASVWFARAPARRSAQAVVLSSAAASLWVYGPLLLGALHA